MAESTYKGRLILEIDIENAIDSRGEAQWELFHAFCSLALMYKEGRIDVADDLWTWAEKLGIRLSDEYVFNEDLKEETK